MSLIDTSAQRFDRDGGSQTRPVDKLVLHTTETGTWPGYGGGASAPHVTVDPRTRQARQHVPYDRAARALRNPSGGVETNRAGVVQVEIIGTCDAGFASKYGYRYLPEMTDDEVDYLGAVLAEVVEAAGGGIPLATAVEWRSYPDSYGAGNGLRLQGDAWLEYRGVLGHQHVPENTHGDPGDLPIERILAAARSGAPAPVIAAPPAAAPVRPAPTNLTGTHARRPTVDLIDLRDVHPLVRHPGMKALQRLVGVHDDGLGGPDTRAALGRKQRQAGVTVDYVFGPDTAEALLAGRAG